MMQGWRMGVLFIAGVQRGVGVAVKVALVVAFVAALSAAAVPPANDSAAVSHALTLPYREALKKADSLSRAKNASDWARAQGLRMLADNDFFREDYKGAAESYKQASALDSASIYKFLYALSMVMAGQAESARGIWGAIAADTADRMSGEAARLLAQLPPEPPEPKAEASKPMVSASPTPTVSTPPTPPAVVSTTSTPPTSTVLTSKVSTPPTPAVSTPLVPPTVVSTPPTPKVLTPAPTVSTTSTVSTPPTVSTPMAVAPSTASVPPKPLVVSPPPIVVAPIPPLAKAVVPSGPVSGTQHSKPAPAPPVFTVQVGAFSNRENADNLVKRLTGKYSDITVSTTTTANGDQTLYRVRVGAFQKREDAVAYADDLIVEAGLSARVVEK